MKLFLICVAAAATLVTVSPASAQVWFDAGPVAMRVGPPPPWARPRVVEERVIYRPAYYAPRCRIIRDRIIRPSGRVVIREREICR
jgi:hypothetical protein